MKLAPIGHLDFTPASQPGIDLFLARRILAGWRPKAIVAAAGGPAELSLRTAYRWCQELVGLQEIVVGRHVATFAIRRTKAPIRFTDWRPVPACPQAAQDAPGAALAVPAAIGATPALAPVLEAVG